MCVGQDERTIKVKDEESDTEKKPLGCALKGKASAVPAVEGRYLSPKQHHTSSLVHKELFFSVKEIIGLWEYREI